MSRATISGCSRTTPEAERSTVLTSALAQVVRRSSQRARRAGRWRAAGRASATRLDESARARALRPSRPAPIACPERSARPSSPRGATTVDSCPIVTGGHARAWSSRSWALEHHGQRSCEHRWPHQLSPARRSQEIGSVTEMFELRAQRRIMTLSSSSSDRITPPSAVRTQVGPCHRSQPRRA